MKTLQILPALLLSAWTGTAQVRLEQTLDKGWRSTRDDRPSFASPACDDTARQAATLPHDWAIYGPFGIGNDLQNKAIAASTETPGTITLEASSPGLKSVRITLQSR